MTQITPNNKVQMLFGGTLLLISVLLEIISPFTFGLGWRLLFLYLGIVGAWSFLQGFVPAAINSFRKEMKK